MKLKIAATVAFTATILAFSAPAYAEPATVAFDSEDYPLAAEFTAAVNAVAANFPEVGTITITSGWLPKYNYATARPGLIIFNKRYTTDPNAFETDMREDIEQGFHPSGCPATWTLGLHEAAHQIDYAHDMRADDVLTTKYGTGTTLYGQLSGYSFQLGAIFPREALAEAFTAVICEGDDATPAEHDLFNILVSTP